MPLPEQLAGVSRELARRGMASADADIYTAGVRDTLVLVGELVQLSASGLGRATGPGAGAPPVERLRVLARELETVILQDTSAAVGTFDPRSRFDLARAHELLESAASRLERALGPVAAAPGTTAPAGDDAPEGRSIWLAAFVLSIARRDRIVDRDVRDALRLAGSDHEVLAAAARKVETAEGIDVDQRRRARELFSRSAALIRDPDRSATS